MSYGDFLKLDYAMSVCMTARIYLPVYSVSCTVIIAPLCYPHFY